MDEMTLTVDALEQLSQIKIQPDQMPVLAEVSDLLLMSRGDQGDLDRLARFLVPQIADWCMIQVLAVDGSLQQGAVAHYDSLREPQLLALQPIFPYTPKRLTPLTRSLQAGESVLVATMSKTRLKQLEPDPGLRALLAAQGIVSCLIVPCCDGETLLGVITLVSVQPGQHYTSFHLQLAEAIAQRVTVVLANSRRYAAARRALQQRDELLAAVVHDLKTPLGIIRGRNQLARQQATGLGPSARPIVEQLILVDEAAKRLTRELTALLDTARIQLGEPVILQRCSTDLVALIQRCLTDQQLTTARHQLRLDAAVDTLVGNWDGERLAQVIDNLLANAIRYSPRGEIRVVVTQEERNGISWGVVIVQDHGIGIPGDDLPHIFDLFYRASNVVGQIRGTGMGLAIVSRLVALHNGTIEVDSTVGRGSSFIVQLPCKP